MKTKLLTTFVCLAFLQMGGTLYAQNLRIKDLVNIRGVRTNQLVGFGLVIGLAGSGDSEKSLVKNRAVSNLMTKIGMKMTPEEATTRSAAAVIVTAELPAFMRNGDKIDVKVSSIGDAKSLAGGSLLLTPLKAGDGEYYVSAQGGVIVGQANGSGTQVLTSAMVPNGGVVEREFFPNIAPRGKLTLSLKNPDFTTNSRIAEGINIHFKGFYARSLDPVSVEVEIPPLYTGQLIDFIAELESLRVEADQKAVVVLNERTGTVVMGADVAIGKISISHGDLAIRVGSSGKAKDESSKNPESVVNVGGSTVGDLVQSMNALGVKPADLVGILQAIHAAGALRAELKIL